jgi:hypothetical protein
MKMKVSKTDYILNVGHITAISALQVDDALTKLRALPTVYNKVPESLTFEVLSKFSNIKELSKSFEFGVVYAKPQSDAFNNLQSVYEAALKKDLVLSLDRVVNNTDWANQESSASLIDAIIEELSLTAKKRGAKTPNRNKKSRAPAKASLTVSGKRKKTTGKTSVNLGLKLSSQKTTESPLNLRSLIPILNQSLPEIIRSNMGQGGRLVNRTGRFAESVNVVDFDGAIMTYSYQKAPYQVFESQGARDPRPLIEQSIRELATGIIERKFNLRRV